MISKITNVSKEYKTKRGIIHALNGVSFDINDKDFISIVGPSGSGKTTLLSIIGCLIHPSSGEVYFDNNRITQATDIDLCKLRGEHIGFIFQFTYLISHLNVLENVLLPFYVLGRMVTDELKKDAIRLLSMLEMDDRLDFFPRELSGGEIQKTAIARSLIHRPKLILADEPTGDLDYKISLKIFNFFKEINNQGITIVVVTHSPELAGFAKNIYEMEKGYIKSYKDILH